MRYIRYSIFLLLLASFACRPSSSPKPIVETTMPAGAVLFQDDFSSPNSGWDHLLTAEGIMDYDGGGYRILVNALQTNFWSTPHKDYANVRIEVEVGKLAGPDENRLGLICRYSGADYYFFIISSDGYYGLGIFTGGQIKLLGQEQMLFNENIHRGVTVNRLRADCIGNTLTFFVNGFQVAQIQDSTLASGDVGLLVGAFSQPGVDIIFDNFAASNP